MNEQMKELLDVYERFELTKSAQGALDFARRNMESVGVNPVEFELPTVQAVDLGLPSGRLWADRNVGAKSPEDCGLYFSWGNVEGVEQGKVCDFTEEAYRKTEGSEIDEADIDPNGGLDAARVNLGEPWRMPTMEDFEELDKHCTHEWTEQGGYSGMKFTSKKNGNSIFLPASGYGYGSSWNFRGAYGHYWSASFNSARNARGLSFRSGGVSPQSSSNRYDGFAVRAVQN